MTIRDLTNKQIEQLRRATERDLKKRLERWKAIYPEIPIGAREAFRDGFSDGVKATLEMFTTTNCP